MNPAIPPRPDVSYVGATKPLPPTPPERSQSMSSSTSSAGSVKGYPRDRREPPPPPIPPHPDGDWEAREEMRNRELDEARARAAQMEKTMRWWSDCTANWREKWSKVRNERNKARDENRNLRSKLEASIKENTQLKREKQEQSNEIETLRKQLEVLQGLEKDGLATASVCSSGSHKSSSDADVTSTTNISNKKAPVVTPSVTPGEDFVCKLLSKKDKDIENNSTGKMDADKTDKSEKKKHSKKSMNSPSEDVLLQQRVTALELKLDESQKVLQVEREEKNSLTDRLMSLESELVTEKTKSDEMSRSYSDVKTQLQKVQSEAKNELGRMVSELEDEEESRSDMDKQLADLRRELEKLQAENAAEWGKSERLETEKLALERENKKIKIEMDSLNEELERKTKQTSAMVDSDMKSLNLELTDKNKELAELRHSHVKLKKSLSDKSAELEHSKSRAEQYEMEVKKLRARIEELKRDLATAEDDVDQQSNQVRKITRENDELQQQCDNLKVQVEHLNTRLRRSNSNQPPLVTRASSLKNFELENDSTEDQTDEEEAD